MLLLVSRRLQKSKEQWASLDSIGRTDLPGGSFEQLMDSINDNILTLGDDFTVYSGHGRETTIGKEKATNPFLTGVYQMTRGRFL